MNLESYQSHVVYCSTLFKLILLHLLFASAAQVTVEPEVVGLNQSVTAKVRGDVILPCYVKPPTDVSNLTVEWKCNKTVVHMYKSRNDNEGAQHKRFRKRTSLFHNQMIYGNISLKLTSVTEADAGIYTCSVRKLYKDKVKRSSVNLTVEGENGRMNQTVDPTTGNNNLFYLFFLLVIVVPIAAAAVYWKKTRQNKKRHRSGNGEGPRGGQQEVNTGLMDNAGNTGQSSRGRRSPKKKGRY